MSLSWVVEVVDEEWLVEGGLIVGGIDPYVEMTI
jgi:hypothetical protein